MSVHAQPALPERILEIRSLHVVSGGGETAEFRSVRCPALERAVPLEQCLSCPESGGLFPPSVGRADRVACRSARVDEPGSAPASGPAVRGLADRTPVSAVMTARVLAVRPDISLDALADLLLDRGIGGAPVVDDEGRPVGVVSKTDLVRGRLVSGDTGEAVAPGWHPSRGHFRIETERGFHVEALPGALVADVMTPTAFTLSEDAPLAQAAALMAFEGVHRVPVVSHDGRVAGIVTTLDVLRWMAQQEGYLSSAGLRRQATAPEPAESA
jgi:CBS domain-containing protein